MPESPAGQRRSERATVFQTAFGKQRGGRRFRADGTEVPVRSACLSRKLLLVTLTF